MQPGHVQACNFTTFRRAAWACSGVQLYHVQVRHPTTPFAPANAPTCTSLPRTLKWNRSACARPCVMTPPRLRPLSSTAPSMRL
eukprot:364988-Chlamydomonas_euryale.AAC.8